MLLLLFAEKLSASVFKSNNNFVSIIIFTLHLHVRPQIPGGFTHVISFTHITKVISSTVTLVIMNISAPDEKGILLYNLIRALS